MSSSNSIPPIIPLTVSHNLDYVCTYGRTTLAESCQCKSYDLHCRLCGMNFGQNKSLHSLHFHLHREQPILFRKKRIGFEVNSTEKSADIDEIEDESTCLIKLHSITGHFKLALQYEPISSAVTLLVQNASCYNIQLTDIFMFNVENNVPLLHYPEILAQGEEFFFSRKNAAYHPGEVNNYVLRYLLLPVKTELIEVYRLEPCMCACDPQRSLKYAALAEYPLPKNMKNIIKTLKGQAVIARLNPINYVETFHRFIELEEYFQTLELENFNFEITLTKLNFKPIPLEFSHYYIMIPNVVPKLPLLTKYDQFWMKPKGDTERIRAIVKKILPNEILIEVVTKKTPMNDKTYEIEFILHRLQFQMEHRALDFLKTFNLIDLMFPKQLPAFSADKILSHIQDLQWFNENIRNNPEQREAVLGIVNGVSCSAPYLIFGPPGTGKTATITEAICQLLRIQPDSRILVTASSNAAADEMALRVLKYLPNVCYFEPHNIYRLYAAQVRIEVTDPQLLANSNYTLEKFPDWTVLSKYRVLICTPVTCGRLMFKPPSAEYFTHLFVDECGSTTEPAALIPIIVCSSREKINAQLILAGDPKQLGPVVKCKIAERMGFGESMIARLMNRESYQRNLVTKAYCSRMLTRLLKNYRSHPDIIGISNDLFYNGELQPSASVDKTHCYLGWRKLPNIKVPIIFDITLGKAVKEENSVSWFNKAEIDKVIYYVNLLLVEGIKGKRLSENDIGVISPYKRQCQRIETEFNNRNFKVMTASVELFQGKEKPVIIVSTVRSGHQGVGFLDNPKRLNVLLTRAQSLMIIIGDPNVLQKDRNWYAVLERLINLNVVTGPKFVLSSKRPSSSKDKHSDNWQRYRE